MCQRKNALVCRALLISFVCFEERTVNSFVFSAEGGPALVSAYVVRDILPQVPATTEEKKKKDLEKEPAEQRQHPKLEQRQ